MRKRNNIEGLILPITWDSDDDDDSDCNDDSFKYLQNRWHFSDSLRSLPQFVLLFNDASFDYRKSSEQCIE